VRAPHNGSALRKWGIRRSPEDDFLNFYGPRKIKFPITSPITSYHLLSPMKKTATIEQQIAWILWAGIIWGLVEIILSKGLKIWQPALFSILMPLLVAIFIMLVKRLVPLKGSILFMGMLAATIKFFYSGLILHGPFMAILIEAFLAEIIFLTIGSKFIGDCLVGISIEMYSAFHPFLTTGMLCNSIHLLKFKRLVAHLLDVPKNAIGKITILSLYVLFHFLAGLMAAVIVKFILSYVKTRSERKNPAKAGF